ncbi:MAG: hypothetical protein MUE52_03610 [Tabrizicola sp.]|nr:hypothetical protein [Tabrizicola sp.]
MSVASVLAAAAIEPPPTFMVETLRFAEATGAAVDMSGVDLVIAPLIGPDFDAAELIGWLGRASFRGRMRVVTRPLADRSVVLWELRSLAAPFGIALDLFETGRS